MGNVLLLPKWEDLKLQGIGLYQMWLDARADGKVTFTEVIEILNKAGDELAKHAVSVSGITEDEACEWAESVLTDMYFDKELGINFNVPAVPEFAETPVEKWLIAHFSRKAVRFAWSLLSKDE